LTTLATAFAEISLGVPEFKMGHVTRTTPILRLICHPCAGSSHSLCSKFDHSSFSRVRDMVGAHQNLNCSHDLINFLYRYSLFIRGLALATSNLTPCTMSIRKAIQNIENGIIWVS